MQYEVNMNITIYVDADSKDEAIDIAEEELSMINDFDINSESAYKIDDCD